MQCRKCLGFCLFGVYALDNKSKDNGNSKGSSEDTAGTAVPRVRVVRPRACKNGCPACARVCPQLAIIFPKCKDSPINGAPIREEDLARKDLKVNVEELAKSPDLYAELRKRASGEEMK